MKNFILLEIITYWNTQKAWITRVVPRDRRYLSKDVCHDLDILKIRLIAQHCSSLAQHFASLHRCRNQNTTFNTEFVALVLQKPVVQMGFGNACLIQSRKMYFTHNATDQSPHRYKYQWPSSPPEHESHCSIQSLLMTQTKTFEEMFWSCSATLAWASKHSMATAVVLSCQKVRWPYFCLLWQQFTIVESHYK